jgi:16S rRNA (uracil1498-N3)-methyltransferase
MKQSGRAWLPEVHDACTLGALAERAREYERVVVADADAPRLPNGAGARATMAVVGPEGGLTDAEIARLVAMGAERASVSSHRLRSETAAVVVMAALVQRV